MSTKLDNEINNNTHSSGDVSPGTFKVITTIVAILFFVAGLYFGLKEDNIALLIGCIIIGTGVLFCQKLIINEVSNEPSKNTISKEERWRRQADKDRLVLDMFRQKEKEGDVAAAQFLNALSVIELTWSSFEYLSKDEILTKKRKKYYATLFYKSISPEIFLKCYYKFKNGVYEDIKDAIYEDYPYIVHACIINMGRFIFDSKNNIYVLKEIIFNEKCSNALKIKAQEILKSEEDAE